MIVRVYAFLVCKRGHTAMEYGLMMCLAALGIITALTFMGEKTASSLNKVADAFQ
jgi:Flp pilus assembly pilin Flp